MRETSEDLFASTRMSFGDHIEELRAHMIRALLGFAIALCASFAIGWPVLRFIASPVEAELMKKYHRRVETALEKAKASLPGQGFDHMEITLNRNELARALGIKEPAAAGEETVALTIGTQREQMIKNIAAIQAEIGRPPSLVALTITEGFVVYLKVCVYCAIVMASPWIFYQLWSFVAAGLYPQEKRYIHVYLPMSVGLFLAGVAVCEFLVIPKAVEYLLGFNEWLGLEPELRLNEWLSFAIMMPLIFGIAFQTPLVMLFLDRLGIMSAEGYRKHRRLAMFLLACAAAVLGASPDIFSWMSLTIPLWILYELGIFLCRFSPRAQMDVDVPEPEEMVEV